MIKNLQKRFITTAMIAVTILLVLLLGGIAAVNAWSGLQSEKQLLSSVVAMEAAERRDGPPRGDDPPPDAPFEADRPMEDVPPENGPDGSRPFDFFTLAPTENDRMSAVYFTVTVVGGGPVSADVSRISSVTEAEAMDYAVTVLQSGRTEGKLDSFRYASAHRSDGSDVYVFLDRTAQKNAILRVAALAGLAAVVGWVLMLLLVIFLSRKAIRPIAENMERQRQFVTDAGHELKTPLSIIQANTEAMELVTGETKYSRNIRAQVGRLTELTGDLLMQAKADELPDRRSFVPLDLAELVEQSLSAFLPSMEQKKLEVTREIRKGLQIRGDNARLTTLLSILFDNAVKYTPEGGAVRIVLDGQDWAKLRIENDCASLPDCPPERLFDRFYRADAARTQKTGGFGIGLSSARSIAGQLKGSLTAEYVRDERIAFVLTLPVG